jgi:ADP-ribosylglycohydrolase
MLGLALGDAIGAPHEGGPVERALWAVLGLGSGGLLRWTDDTQMAAVAAESLLHRRGLDADDLARRWAAEARFLRGYGPGTWKLLAKVRAGTDWRIASRAIFPEGSYGNGAAMRAAPFALYFRGRPDDLEGFVEAASVVTHAHPLAVEGAVLMAFATIFALEQGFEPRSFLARLGERCRRDEFRARISWALDSLEGAPDASAVRERLGTGVAAHQSVVTALYAFCRHPDDFGSMMRFVIGLGGDTDTIGSMSGALFGARNGLSRLPADLVARLEDRDRIERLGRTLASAAA